LTRFRLHGRAAGTRLEKESSMLTRNLRLTLLALLAGVSAASCGDDDDGGGSPATGGIRATGGRANASGGRPGTGGLAPIEAGAAGAAACTRNGIRDYLPPTDAEDPGPDCEAYGDCMREGCGEQYEPAFGPDWASGDLGGGVCGPAVPCLEECECDQACLTGCLLIYPECLGPALAFQGCYAACTAESEACDAERRP
jgi:hypothetical protein